MSRKNVIVLMLWNLIMYHVDSCTFPAILEGKTWEDSDKGRPITFSASEMTGWNVTFGGETISSWTCLYNKNNIIVFKSSYQFVLPPFPPQTKQVYVCMWTVSVEADKMIYYLLADEISINVHKWSQETERGWYLSTTSIRWKPTSAEKSQKDVDSYTRLYVSDDSSLGACDVCKLDLSLDTSQGKAMVTSGSPSSVTIPGQSGPCSGCSCSPTTEATTTFIASTTSITSASSETSTTSVTFTSSQESTTSIASTSYESSSTSYHAFSVSTNEFTIGLGNDMSRILMKFSPQVCLGTKLVNMVSEVPHVHLVTMETDPLNSAIFGPFGLNENMKIEEM